MRQLTIRSLQSNDLAVRSVASRVVALDAASVGAVEVQPVDGANVFFAAVNLLMKANQRDG